MKTKTLLVQDLRKKPQTLLVQTMIANALRGYYHDWESVLDRPKTQLCVDLKKAGLHDLARAVIIGRYG